MWLNDFIEEGLGARQKYLSVTDIIGSFGMDAGYKLKLNPN